VVVGAAPDSEMNPVTIGAELIGSFSPVVDGKTYFNDYDKRRAAGKFIQRPFIAGCNDNEAGLFAMQGGPRATEAGKKQTNLGYCCGAATAVEGRLAKKIKAWRYRWMAEFPGANNATRAWHASEISSVFGLVEKTAGKEQTEVSTFMNKAWAEFAKNPEGLSKLNLPVYSAKDQTLIMFAAANQPVVSLVTGNKFDGECGTLTNNLPSAPPS